MYRLLVVDDEYAVTDGLYELFISESDLELDVKKAYCGNSALEIMTNIRVDILVTDISMPDIDGIELLKNTLKIWRHCKTILLTGYDDFSYIQQVMRLGAIDYVVKTESDEVLLKAVRKAIRLLESEGVPFISEDESIFFGNESLEYVNRVIIKVNTYIEKNVFNNLSVVKISKDLHYNPSYISRLYKQVTGKNLTDSIWIAKILKAKELLQDPDNKVYDISRKLGFESSSYFSRFFKKHTGLLPQEYREKHCKQSHT